MSTSSECRVPSTKCQVLVFLLLFASTCLAQGAPHFRVGIYADARYINSDKQVSWLDGGLGKLRYGGEDADRANLFRLSQLSFLLNADITESLSAKVQLNVDAEPDRGVDRRRLDVIEAFASFHPFLSTHTRMKLKGGIFFPPISLENTDIAWTSPYTITSSALNSWIGEEVRSTGGEFNFIWSGMQNELTLTAAAFGFNDPTGSLLGWRGWALQDRQTGYKDKLPLPPLYSIGPGGTVFPRQPLWVEPFREVDNRVGYYGGVAFNNSGWLDARSLYFDNRGDPKVFDGKQYAWHTRFGNAGVHLSFPHQFEILAQYLRGRSQMGFRNQIDFDFYASYILGSIQFGKNRFSVRYDDFWTRNNDSYYYQDDNDEDGSAWTAAYALSLNNHFRLMFEFLNSDSTRPNREELDVPDHFVERQAQVSFRVHF